ncbi:MAG: exonuclease domain-containing protein [Phascolarctobacterium sp.]
MSYIRQEALVKDNGILACPDNYIVIDIETTGLSPVQDEITEIAAIKYRNNRKVEEFVTLVKPEGEISPFITKLTGISKETVAHAPSIDEVIEDFARFVGEDILVGYNVAFDISFLSNKLENCCGLGLFNDYVDVMRLSRDKLPFLGNPKQTVLAKYFSIAIEGAHRATVDCEICNKCYQKLKQLYIPGYELPPDVQLLKATESAVAGQPFAGKRVAFLGVLEGLDSQNLVELVQALGAEVVAEISPALDMVIVGTGDESVCTSEEMQQVLELKNQGAAVAMLKDSVFVKSLQSRGWVE